ARRHAGDRQRQSSDRRAEIAVGDRGRHADPSDLRRQARSGASGAGRIEDREARYRQGRGAARPSRRRRLYRRHRTHLHGQVQRLHLGRGAAVLGAGLGDRRGAPLHQARRAQAQHPASREAGRGHRAGAQDRNHRGTRRPAMRGRRHPARDARLLRRRRDRRVRYCRLRPGARPVPPRGRRPPRRARHTGHHSEHEGGRVALAFATDFFYCSYPRWSNKRRAKSPIEAMVRMLKSRLTKLAATLVLPLLLSIAPPSANAEVRIDQVKIDSWDGKRALAIIVDLLRFTPRSMETPGHQQAIDYIMAELKKTKFDTIKTQRWIAREAGRSMAMTNIIARFNPSNPRRVIVATHFDSIIKAYRDPKTPDAPMPGANNSA